MQFWKPYISKSEYHHAMHDLDLTSLRLFVAVCETRNIARAAERQAIVGSAISKRLSALEATVGTPLLQRRRRGVEPTPAGEALLEHARALLAGQERIARDMAAFAAGVRGQVRIPATASAIAESLADDVAAFLKQPEHRDIRIDIEERVSTGVLSGLREGVAALGICWDVADFAGLQTRPWRGDQLSVVVPRGHPLAAQASVWLAQTLDEDHVSLPPSSAVQLMLQRAAALAGKPLNYRVVVATFDAALRVVRAGLANVYAALLTGVNRFDACLAGIGGCPHAPGASGNVATEDLAYLLRSMGLDTGIDLPALLALRAQVAGWLAGESLHGTIAQAGLPRTLTPAAALA